MSGICSDMDTESILRAKAYYEELLSSMTTYYDYVHRIIYQFLCIIGVIANIAIIVILLRPSMRKNAFNLFLIAIAICDMSLMASYFVYKQVELCHPWYFTFAWIVYTYSYAVLSVFVHSASLWMTVNMAVLRYLVLRSSANSSRRWPRLNTYKAALISIGIAILIAAVGSAPNMLRYQIYYNGELPVPGVCLSNGSRFASLYTANQKVHAYVLTQPSFWTCRWERVSFWTAGLLLKIVPCLLLTIFMTLLVRLLVEARDRRNRLQGAKNLPQQSTTTIGQHSARSQSGALSEKTVAGGQSKGQAERTSEMLTIIVAVFLITELPQGILVIAIGVKPQVVFAMSRLSNIIDLLSLLNSSVNFILYATMSNLFRAEFYQTFGQCCPHRFFNFLKKHSTATEKSSPAAGPKEQHTILTGFNGGPAMAANSKLITMECTNSGSDASESIYNGSPSKLAVTGQQLASIARIGIRNNTSATAQSSRSIAASNVKKQPKSKKNKQGGLPVAIASATVNLVKKAQEKEDAFREEEEEDQRRRLLLENGGTSSANTTAGTPRRQ